MTSSCHLSRFTTTFVLQKRVARKIGYGVPNENKELELDYMEHDYKRKGGHKRSHGTFRKLKVVVQSHMMLFDIFKIVKRTFMSLEIVYFHFHSLLLIQEQISNTEHYS